MADTNRRKFIGGLAFAAGGLATTGSLALENDGHAAGYEVARASDYTSLIPRRARRSSEVHNLARQSRPSRPPLVAGLAT